jgi:hypothetical protein
MESECYPQLLMCLIDTSVSLTDLVSSKTEEHGQSGYPMGTRSPVVNKTKDSPATNQPPFRGIPLGMTEF